MITRLSPTSTAYTPYFTRIPEVVVTSHDPSVINATDTCYEDPDAEFQLFPTKEEALAKLKELEEKLDPNYEWDAGVVISLFMVEEGALLCYVDESGEYDLGLITDFKSEDSNIFYECHILQNIAEIDKEYWNYRREEDTEYSIKWWNIFSQLR